MPRPRCRVGKRGQRGSAEWGARQAKWGRYLPGGSTVLGWGAHRSYRRPEGGQSAMGETYSCDFSEHASVCFDALGSHGRVFGVEFNSNGVAAKTVSN